MVSSKMSTCLKINRLRISGHCHREIAFTDGLNIIEGDNGLGKTTLMRLLQFGLGVERPFQTPEWRGVLIPELKDSKSVLVEIEVNNRVITLKRELKQLNTVKVSSNAMDDFVYNNADYFIRDQEFSDFLLSSLNIPPVEVHSQSGGQSRTLKLSLDHLYRMIYLDQDLGYMSIGNSLPDDLRQAVTELLLNIINVEYYDLQIAEQVEKNRRAQLRQQLQHVQNFVEKLRLLSAIEINARRMELLSQHSTISSEITELKNEMRANPAYRNDLRQRIVQLDAKLENLKTKWLEAHQALNRYELANASVSQERERVQRAAHAHQVLSSYSIKICPGCNQPLDREMHARRLQNLCELCGRPNLIIEDTDKEQFSWRQKVLKDEEKEIADLRELRLEEITRIDAEIEHLTTERAEISEQLNTLRDEFVNDLINQIEERRIMLGRIEQELSLLDYQEKTQAQITDIQKELSQVEEEIEKIKERKDKEEQRIAEARQVIQELQSALHSFLEAIEFLNLDRVTIDTKTYLPSVNGRRYQQLSATQRNLTILGYYYALLRVSLTCKTNYPRLLIIDSVRKDDIDQHTMVKCLEKFKELENLFGIPFQVLIAMRQVPAAFQEDVQLRLHGDNYLLTCDAAWL